MTDVSNADGTVVVRDSAALFPAEITQVRALLAAAEVTDGMPALSEQARLRIGPVPPGVQPDGVRHLLLLPNATAADADRPAEVLGYAQLADESPDTTMLEFAVAPAARGTGLGRRLANAARGLASGREVRAWAHGDLPAARALAAEGRFVAVRELRQLRVRLGALPDVSLPAGISLRAFRPGADDRAWLAVNALAFASHPEQGRWTQDDLTPRLASPDFDPSGFLLAERPDGSLAGFHWTKVAAGVGEVYVLGVDPAEQGTGLGKAVLIAGLRHLAAVGVTDVVLYVDADNEAAVRLYERFGFTTAAVDVLYAGRA